MKRLLTILMVLTSVLVLSACNGNGIQFELIGEAEVNYTTNTPYKEKGFFAKDESLDLSEFVTMEGNINPTVSGDYVVKYTLEYKDETYELERLIHYREEGCGVILGTNITQCDTVWTQYLHTQVTLRVYYEDDEYHDVVGHIFDNIENIISKYNDLSDKYTLYDGVTNVKTINDDPTATHTITPELYNLIKFTLDHQGEVDNRFNLALGPVLKIWHDAREACPPPYTATCDIPNLQDLLNANQYTDWNDITLNETNSTITMKENMSIDLGGVSKGYISDLIIDYLEGLDLRGYLLNNGQSNVSTGGTHPTRENGKFLLAITDPNDPFSYYATVYIGDGDQLVTSGDYQQYFISDGDIYHHIINPTTLMPDMHMKSVSIITDDAGLADLYSTAIFTMSIEDGIDFVNNIDGMEGIWYATDGTLYYSENFEAKYLKELN